MTGGGGRLGYAPRHRELARLAIGRVEVCGEGLEEAITWAIDAALREATGVEAMTADGRMRAMPRARALLRLRGSATPMELAKATGSTSHIAWAVLQRLVAAGFARRGPKGRYLPAEPAPVGRPSNASRGGAALSWSDDRAGASPAAHRPRRRVARRARRQPAA